MKKQQVKRNAILPVGRVITDLCLWDFSGNEDVIRHNANELARAIQLSFQLDNFGLESFGLTEEDLE